MSSCFILYCITKSRPGYSINFEPGLFCVSKIFLAKTQTIVLILTQTNVLIEEVHRMKKQLIKAMQRNQFLNMMYMALSYCAKIYKKATRLSDLFVFTKNRLFCRKPSPHPS